MTMLEIIFAILGAAVIALVLWNIHRHGTVPPTLDVDPDDRRGIGG